MQQVREIFRNFGVFYRWTHSFLCVFVPCLRHLLVAALVSGCLGQASADVESQRITAFLGESVILPCSIPSSHDVPTVEWSKEGLAPKFVFLYRDGCEMFDTKNPHFRYRTSLIMNDLLNGNLSLRISNLLLSDKGTYWCKILRGKQPEAIAKLELVVASEPNLTVVESDTGDLTVQCEVKCWAPEPEFTFLDDQEREMAAEKPERPQDAGPCFSIIRRVKIQSATNRVTCRVHQQQFNVTRATEIHVAVNCMGSWFIPVIVTVLVTLLACAVVYPVCWKYFLKKRVCNVKEQKLPVSPDQGVRWSISNNPEYENLLRENENLKSILEAKDEEIHRLTQTPKPKGLKHEQNNVSQKNRPPVEAGSSADATELADPPFQRGPEPAVASTSSQKNLPQAKDQNQAASSQSPRARPHTKDHRNKSAPAFLTDSDASALNSGDPLTRSLSLSRPRPNAAKPQRRHTVTSVMFQNRYQALENLEEES